MKKVLIALLAAAFTTGIVYAGDDKKPAKKPTAEQCKKDPKLKGCPKPKK